MSTTTSTDQFQQSELALIEPDCAAPPNKRPKLSSKVGVIRVLMGKVRSPFFGGSNLRARSVWSGSRAAEH